MGRYPWPGNVRELRNALENMVLLAAGSVLVVDDVPESIRRMTGSSIQGGGPTEPIGAGPSNVTSGHGGGYDLAGRPHQEVERALILANLELMEGNRKRAAEVLGIGERTLYRKLKEYGMT